MKTVFMRLFVLTACLFAAPVSALTAELTVVVTDAAGKPVASAVVSYVPSTGAAIPAGLRSATYTLTQKKLTFAPYVLAVPAGATVSFPNQDRVNHHVYSFSKVQPFQFPLYGQGKTRTMKFDHPGTVAVACNIHDSMSAYIRVVDTPYFAMTDASGRSTLAGVPEAAGVLSVWHPLMDAPEHSVSRNLASGRASGQAFTVKVRGGSLPTSGAY
jgi:plastocyanin